MRALPSTGILGGTFDPPHNGHLAVAEAAQDRFDLERLVVLVAANPGHKRVQTAAETRLLLAQAAFPDHEVTLDEHAFTVDAVAGARFGDAIFLIGADEFCGFPTWKDPDGVLAQVKLGVATRPGYPSDRLQEVLQRLEHPERVDMFEIPPVDIASSDLRRRVAAGESISPFVPPEVARIVGELGLYRD